ncbi:TBC domain-containing protein [Rutstroemia sp. NJR-2017a BBW]|nr:TBC domain-containing protein [Rutstroemia sp. NJR-2017a BBW]
MESQKVRSMYESGSALDWRDGKDDTAENRLSANGQPLPDRPVTANSYLTPNGTGVPQRSTSALSNRRAGELAGGIEDWEDSFEAWHTGTQTTAARLDGTSTGIGSAAEKANIWTDTIDSDCEEEL